MVALHLAMAIGGSMFFGFVSTVIFAPILAGQLASEGLPEEHSLELELEALKFFSVPERSVVNQ